MLLYVFCQIFEPTVYAGLQPADAGLLRLGRQELDVLLLQFGVPKTSSDGKLHDAVICADVSSGILDIQEGSSVPPRCVWREGASWDAGRDVQSLQRIANPHAGQGLDLFQMSCRTLHVSVAVGQGD